MSVRLHNTLAGERGCLGWSQSRMAEAAGISRQSYAAIESGRSTPSTEVALRLASALGRPVEALFRIPGHPLRLEPAGWGGAEAPRPGNRVRLSRIAGRSMAHPLTLEHRPGSPSDGVVESVEDDAVAVRTLPERPPTPDLVVLGCDPAFGVVADALREERGIEVLWCQRGSRGALAALARGQAHVAGVHLYDAATERWNEPAVRDLVPFACTRVSFAVWEQGLLVRPGRRGRIDGVHDLTVRGVRLVNRESGSGSRALLDDRLAAAGVETGAVRGYDTAATGHLSVADAIAAGAADAGVAIRAAGLSRGLDFRHLRDEPYELVIPDHFLGLAAVDALLSLLRRPGIRSQVEAMGGYDGAHMGQAAP